jgi:hypothetical protein
MSKKLAKVFAAFVLIAGVIAAAPDAAQARWHGHYWGGWGGPHIYFGWGYPPAYPYYYRPYYRRHYYAPAPDCGYVRVRYWRHGHWRLRRVWRCW